MASPICTGPNVVGFTTGCASSRPLASSGPTGSLTTHDPDERENILHTIEGLDNSIEMYDEQLFEEGCYAPTPPPPNFMLKITGIEITQSVQYFSVEGSGAGVDNRVPLILNKPLLARAYLELVFSDPMRVTGRALVMEFNNQTLKYDRFRLRLDPLNPVSMAGSSSSRAAARSMKRRRTSLAVCWRSASASCS